MPIFSGTFLGFWPAGNGKFIRIHDGTQEQRVKLPKYMRAGLRRELVVGMGVKVAVRWHDQGWQATDILLFPALAPLGSPANRNPCVTATQPACRVEVCHKGNCRKQGSMRLWQQLSEIIQGQGWQEWVFLEASGCQKACKQAPNVRINGQPYHQAQVHTLIPELAARVQQATQT